MKGINNYINEKLQINTKGNIAAKFANASKVNGIPTHKKDGTELMWFRVYYKLLENGPMTKKEVLKSLGLVETSYATMFAAWAKYNMIVPMKTKGDRGKLIAKSPDEWDSNAKAY